MIRITLERKALISNATPKMKINWTIFLVALMPFVDTDRIKLIKERDVHCRVNLKQL
ncbi:hypothetical protein T12_7851 [Trichinella patagoniensis]|uniref:Uncharacterized protein n=1 Tax=Trichinella patagoniensis TaxID=990121 RepID=A0A0V0YQ94_9BILA|nr:hypothetical protein T12_7851 [Trichinella patagoniensis]